MVSVRTGLLALVAGMAAAASAHAVTPLGGSLDMQTYAFDGMAARSSNADVQTWSATPPGSLGADSISSEPGVVVQNQATAYWSATSGVVGFDETMILSDPTAFGLFGSIITSAPDWTYDFIADHNGAFTMTWSLNGPEGGDFFMHDWQFTNDGAYVGGPTFFEPLAGGTFTMALVAGQTYHLALSNENGGGGIPGGYDRLGTYQWSIAEDAPTVPEPAVWALLLTGFGGLGAVRRRQRRLATI